LRPATGDGVAQEGDEMAADLHTEQGVVRIPLGTWNADPIHSSVEFSIKHMMIATVRGRLKEFEGTITAAEDINDSKATCVVKMASVDTNEPTRDEHLRSPDFFDVEHFPEARFESKRIIPQGGSKFRMVGDVTLKDVTREVEFDATIEGFERDPWGNDRVGMSIRGTIDRTDFGLTWQRALEAGGLLLGETVTITADISAVKAS
jgi:polyisoprenoid-binding protein YceI